jgi:predicted glycosyltransferase
MKTVEAEKQTPRSTKTVWIDLENSPHVPFFRPIIRELEKRGYTVTVTARDCFQVCELADAAHLQYKLVGHHYGKNTWAKFAGLIIRVLQMLPTVLREKPDLSVSHGSRSLFLLSTILRIPTITIMDYEHAKWVGFAHLSWVVAPEVIPEEAFLAVGVEKDHILRYPGIKEDVYTPFFRPSLAFKSSLGLNGNCVIVTVRPPATEAHYHNPESEVLLAEVMEFLSQHPNVKTVMVPRTPNQEHNLRQAWPAMFADGRAIIPKHVVDGLDLIWSSDLVISGGGTMNREAAALGVPVYSIFRGKLGAVDRYLADTGRLVLLQSIEDIHQKLKIVPRDQDAEIPIAGRNALQKVVDHIVSVLESK